MQIARRAFLALTAAAPAAALAGPAHASATGLIGVSLPSQARRWSLDAKIMANAFKVAGHATDAEFAFGDASTQISQIENMIATGISALVIAPVEATALTPVLANAAALDIPAFAYARPIRDTAGLNYCALFDDFQAGAEQARSLAAGLGECFAGQRPWQVELFAGEARDAVARQLFDGAMSILSPMRTSGEIIIRSGQDVFANCATKAWDRAIAHVRMDGILARSYADGRLHGVLSPDDGLSGGIISSLAGAGYGFDAVKMPIVTGLGCSPAVVRQIITGHQYSSVFRDSRVLARATAQLVSAVLSGAPPRTGNVARIELGVGSIPSFLLSPVTVDAANWKKILVHSGYYRLDQLK